MSRHVRNITVYVAGPYTRGDQIDNVRNAMLVCDDLITLGYAPYCPHLTAFQHLFSPHPYDVWMELDMALLRKCDCLLRMPGESPGADEEVSEAKSLGKKVFYSIEELRAYYGERNDE